MSDAEGPSYVAAALQLIVDPVTPAMLPEEARAHIGRNIARLERRLAQQRAWIGDALRLVVLPEFLFTGFPRRQGADQWIAQACFAPEGPEYAALGKLASGSNLFIAGNAYETDPHFPGLYFQTSFVIAPSGELVLRYRRLNTMWAASPHDVWDRYLDVYGLEGVFPVADTELGRLAAIASEEVLFPEVARCHAMRGAELFLHSTAEYSSPIGSPKETCKIARAIENGAFLVSANAGGFRGPDGDIEDLQGHSMIVDPRGVLLAKGGVGDGSMTYATIDIAAVRRLRAKSGMDNLICRQRFEAYAASYATLGTLGAHALEGDGGSASLRDRLTANQARAIANFASRSG